MSIAEQIATYLLQIKAIKLSPQSPFTWASGIKSPIYCDNRLVLSYPEIRQQVIAAMVEKSKAFEPFDVVAGVATAGIPHGVLLADRIQKPFIYIRSKAKAHGRQNQIEGQLNLPAKVLVIEDLISTGGSSLKAVDTVREAGATVNGVMAIFSYGLPASVTAFREHQCSLSTLSNYDTLIALALKNKEIDENDYKLLQDWKSNPTGWAPEN